MWLNILRITNFLAFIGVHIWIFMTVSLSDPNFAEMVGFNYGRLILPFIVACITSLLSSKESKSLNFNIAFLIVFGLSLLGNSLSYYSSEVRDAARKTVMNQAAEVGDWKTFGDEARKMLSTNDSELKEYTISLLKIVTDSAKAFEDFSTYYVSLQTSLEAISKAKKATEKVIEAYALHEELVFDFPNFIDRTVPNLSEQRKGDVLQGYNKGMTVEKKANFKEFFDVHEDLFATYLELLDYIEMNGRVETEYEQGLIDIEEVGYMQIIEKLSLIELRANEARLKVSTLAQ